MKKILCILFASLMLLSMFPLGVFATSSVVNNEWKDISKTSIEYDFEFVYGNEYNLEQYKEDKKSDISLISVMQGYNKELNSCDLFLYVYNPSRKLITKSSEKNTLQLSVYNTNNKSGENDYYKEKLELIDYCGDTLENEFCTNALVLKFRLPGACDGEPGPITQCYNLIDLELLNEDGNSVKNYVLGKTAKFTRKAINEKEYQYLSCEIATLNVLETDVYHTYYRVNTEGINQYQDIQSVYFAIPNSLIKAYGNLWSMHCKWNTHQTNNVLVTSDSALKQKFESWMYGYDPYSKDFDYSVVYGDIAFDNSRFPFAYNAEKMEEYASFDSMAGWDDLRKYDYDDDNFLGDFKAPINSYYDFPLTMVFKSDNVDSYEEKVVDGDEILQYIYAHKVFEDGQWVWNKSLFSNSVSTETTFTVNRKPESLTVYEKCDGWSAFWASKYFDEETNESITVDTFVEIDMNDVTGMSKEEFSKKYLINEEDFRCPSSECGKCLQCRVVATKDDDSTWFMLRYDITDFQAYDALICDNKKGTTQKACLFNCGVINDFDTLSIGFKNIAAGENEVINTFPIGRAPSDFVVDGFTPEHTPKLPEIIKNKLGVSFDWLIFGLKVALIVIAALIVIRVVAPLIPKRTKIKITQGKEKRKK